MKKTISKIIALPDISSNNVTGVWLTPEGEFQFSKNIRTDVDDDWLPVNLYLTIKGEVVVGDWHYNSDNDDISKAMKSLGITSEHKIVSTTDIGLDLPSIAQTFLEEYCEKGGIDEVVVNFCSNTNRVESENFLTVISYIDNNHKPFMGKKIFSSEEVIELLRTQADQIDTSYRPYTRDNVLGWEWTENFIKSNFN